MTNREKPAGCFRRRHLAAAITLLAVVLSGGQLLGQEQKPVGLFGPDGKPLPITLPTVDMILTSHPEFLTAIGNGIVAIVKAEAWEIAKKVFLRLSSSSATFEHGAQVNVDVGDVYKLDATLVYKHSHPLLAHDPSAPHYWWALYINGKKKFELMAGTGHSGYWDEELTKRVSIYLLANTIHSSDCEDTTKDVIAIRTWVDAGSSGWYDVQTKQSHNGTSEIVSENWKEGDQPPSIATVEVVTHNPWRIQLDNFPNEAFGHHDPSTSGDAKFRLVHTRSFPGDRVSDPPKEVNVNVGIFASSGDNHFTFGARAPLGGRQVLPDTGLIAFEQPYQRIGMDSHRDPHEAGTVLLRTAGKVWGQRAPNPEGPKFAWEAIPQCNPGRCLAYEWTLKDKDGDENAKVAQCDWLAGWQLSATTDQNSPDGHLSPQSLEVKDDNSQSDRLIVTPGVGCREYKLPLYGDGTTTSSYFKFETMSPQPPATIPADSILMPDFITEERIFFDSGKPLVVQRVDPTNQFSMPAGATRVIRIEMDIDYMGWKSTLKWSK